MNITINGATHECPPNSNITQLLERLAMQNKRIALEINDEVVPKGEYNAYTLNDGDNIEIIQAIGGG